MTPEEREVRNEAMCDYKSQGHTNIEVAEKFGLHKDTVKKICKGISPQRGRKKKQNKENSQIKKEKRHDKALELIKKGHTAQEITEMLGYSNTSSVYNLAKSHSLKITKFCAQEHEEMRKYKADGHTMGEVAEKFGVSISTVQHVCKGICPQKARPPKDGYTSHNKGVLQDIDNVKRMISERAPNFEYAGNYTGSGGSVDLRCKKCGHVHTHSWHGLRLKGVSVCPNCLEKECKEKKRKQEEAKRLAIENKINKEIEKRRNERGKQVVRLLTRFSRLHRCPVCGTLTDNKFYCSQKCSAKANESLKDARRRKRIKNGLVDKDINLERLYKKHDGVCAICGGKCDWNDHQYRGRYFIVGKKYPSIDHITPLSLGGVHSWDNVQLAHFGCNSKKGARRYG